MAATRTLDLKGLKCPLPVLFARRSLAQMKAGETLELVCTDPMAMIDIPALVQETGDQVNVAVATSDTFVFTIEKRSI